MIVAIDGPAGSGKTTIAKKLAERLGFFYLDTGATYRALTYLALEKGVSLDQEPVLFELAKNIDLEIKNSRVYLGGTCLNREIRTPRIDQNISKIVAFPRVREAMRSLQKNMAQNKDCVIEGRDITTVVFPNAKFKFYLDAAPEERAKRRLKQLLRQGEVVGLAQVKKDLVKRDQADLRRKHGSLKLSKDAAYLDTTNLTVEEVVEELFLPVKAAADEGRNL